MRIVAWVGWCLGLFCGWSGPVSGQVQQQQGVTVQLPVLGVSVDADGLLKAQLFSDVTGRVAQERLLAAQGRQQKQVAAVSPARKISLRRLSEEIRRVGTDGLTDEMRNLAGLKRIEAVYLLPEERDILIAGPAANWLEDLAGRARAVDDGHPTLWLDDLLTALRTFAPGAGLDTWVACSIDPTAEGQAAFREFMQQIPRIVSAAQQAELARSCPEEMARRLGLADIRVWGLPPDSRLATVLIEADYRMKLMAVGLEPAPDVITTFAEAIAGPVSGTQRWWLTPEYDLLVEAPDRMGLQLEGQGVRLNTEEMVVLRAGAPPKQPGRPLKAARQYADSFTRHYRELARLNPLFAELQSSIDMLVISAWLLKRDAFTTVGWDGGALLDAGVLPVAGRTAALRVPCVANAVWKDTLLAFPAGGGVSITPSDALKPEFLRIDREGAIADRAAALEFPQPPDRWWWD